MRATHRRLVFSALLATLLSAASFTAAQQEVASTAEDGSADALPAERAPDTKGGKSAPKSGAKQPAKGVKKQGGKGGTPEKAPAKTALPLTEAHAAAMLNALLEEAIERQENRDVAEAPVIAHLITEVPEAVLASGDGDVSTTGNCAAAYDAFCAKVKPGEGRFVECLTAQAREEEKGNVEGRTLSDGCKAELQAFKQDRATNINKDLPLARACKRDVKRFCAKAANSKNPGAALACLREVKQKLDPRCQKEVFRAQQDGAEDFRADVQLHKYCRADAEKLCSEVTPGGGRVQACLRSNVGGVSWECKEDLFRQEVENADDIRLSVVLLRTCMLEKQKFCADIQAGDAQIMTCLEEHRNDAGFRSECRGELEKAMERRAADFRLDAPLRTACERDVKQVCGQAVRRLDSVQDFDAKVIRCLQDFKDELQAPECVEQVHKVMQRASQDIRFNYPLALECSNDRKKLCPDEQPGSARVIRCLQDGRSELSFECRAALFDHEQDMAEDIDFKYPLKMACAAEMAAFCKDTPHGHARIVRCLQGSLEESSMSGECREQVEIDLVRSNSDYRLNFRLREACEADVTELCPDACKDATKRACGGRALRCLTENSGQIKDPTCQEEVLYFEKMEVNDFRNDILLAEACREDVQEHCAKIKPGEGRVHECLRKHREELRDECRKEELKLNIMAAQDIRLRPKLRKLCSEEMAVYCSEIKPGGGRIMQCLQENLGQPNFGQACAEQIGIRQAAIQSDWQEDYGVATACEADVNEHCPDALKRAHGQSEVLKCLVRELDHLSEQCETQISRAVRMALWEYSPGAALTECCDVDVEVACDGGKKQKRGVFSIGAVGRCLARQLASGDPLDPECRQLVLAAAPSDSRAMINANAAQTILSDKLAELQARAKAAAQNSDALVRARLVNREATGASIITLSGWIAAAAVASMGMVVVISVYAGVRRLLSPSRPYTVIRDMRDGDA